MLDIEQYKVSMVRREDVYLNSWEMGSFIGKLNTYNYKYHLLEAIQIELDNGTDPEDIVIFDSSFNMNNIYSQIGEVKLNSKKIKDLFYIGKPVSLYPDRFSNDLNLIFDYIEFIRKRVKKYGFPLSKTSDLLHISYGDIKEIGFERTIKKIDKYFYSNIDTDNSNNVEKIIESAFERVEKKRDNFERAFSNIEKYKKSILTNEHRTKLDSNSSKYINKFYNLFNRLTRPIVFVHNRQNETYRVLCEGQINKRNRDKSFFDVEMLRHENPYTLIIFMGSLLTAVIATTAGAYATEAAKSKVNKSEVEKNKAIKNKSIKETELAHEKIITEKLKQKEIKNRIIRDESLKTLSQEKQNIANNLNKDINDCKRKLDKNAERAIKGYKMKLKDIEKSNKFDKRI